MQSLLFLCFTQTLKLFKWGEPAVGAEALATGIEASLVPVHVRLPSHGDAQMLLLAAS